MPEPKPEPKDKGLPGWLIPAIGVPASMALLGNIIQGADFNPLMDGEPYGKGKYSPREIFDQYYGEDYTNQALPQAQQYTKEHGSPAGFGTPDYSQIDTQLPVRVGGTDPRAAAETWLQIDPKGGPATPHSIRINPRYGTEETLAVTLPHEMTHTYSDLDYHEGGSNVADRDYYEQPAELDARFAHIKREYYQSTGKIVNSPEEAQKAWDWYGKQTRSWAPEDTFTPHGDEDYWLDPKNLDAFKNRAPQLVEREEAGDTKMAKELIHGGLADYKPDRFYKKDQVQKGTKVELEHVDDKGKAKEIAQDHLEEQRRAGETQNYYDKLLKMEGKKHAAEQEKGQGQLDADPNSTMSAVSPRLPVKKIEENLDQYLSDMNRLTDATVNPESGEFAGTPEQQSKLDWLINITDGLKKVVRQRKYVIKDTLTGGQIRALKDTNTLTTGDKHAEAVNSGYQHGQYLYESGPWMTDLTKRFSENSAKKNLPKGVTEQSVLKGLRAQAKYDLRDLYHFGHDSQFFHEFDMHKRYTNDEALLKQHALAALKSYGLSPGKVKQWSGDLAKISEDEGAKHASTLKKVSPHGKELLFPETNGASSVGSTPETRKLTGGANTNATMGRQAHMAGSQPLSNPAFTGFGDIASHPAQANEKNAFLGPIIERLLGAKADPQRQQLAERLQKNVPTYQGMIADRSKPKPQPQPQKQLFTHTAGATMDVYDQRFEDMLNRKTALIDPREIKVAFFFEGLADSMEKDGYVVANPEAFFTGAYESLREHFEGNAKLASGVYAKHVVNACQLFKDRMVKMANGFAGLAPVNPLDPNAAQQAQQNALGVSPERQEKRQDIIDALLPNAETISLDPDGKIKLKMPTPETAGVMDPQVMQQQQLAEMQSRGQAQGAAQQPIEPGQEDPAAAQLAQGQGAEVSNEEPQMPQQNADSPMMGGEGGSPEEAMLQQLLQGAGRPASRSGSGEGLGSGPF